MRLKIMASYDDMIDILLFERFLLIFGGLRSFLPCKLQVRLKKQDFSPLKFHKILFTENTFS